MAVSPATGDPTTHRTRERTTFLQLKARDGPHARLAEPAPLEGSTSQLLSSCPRESGARQVRSWPCPLMALDVPLSLSEAPISFTKWGQSRHTSRGAPRAHCHCAPGRGRKASKPALFLLTGFDIVLGGRGRLTRTHNPTQIDHIKSGSAQVGPSGGQARAAWHLKPTPGNWSLREGAGGSGLSEGMAGAGSPASQQVFSVSPVDASWILLGERWVLDVTGR